MRQAILWPSSHLAARNDVDPGTGWMGCSLCKRERAGVCGGVVSVGFEHYSVHPYGAPCRARLDLVIYNVPHSEAHGGVCGLV